ncbi:unnamed protein product [Cylicocyclus nassatus]|uniref:Uncharacterized protein n=1 Tax=Cylicocyclus nassatus TaxID=53992 RepID=A0AA36DP78_CYLNA|nr:unnamed protein product [Cylicocyclus nassatus]
MFKSATRWRLGSILTTIQKILKKSNIKKSSSDIHVNSTNENTYLLTLTISPGILKLYDGQRKLIEDGVKSSFNFPGEYYFEGYYKIGWIKNKVELWLWEIQIMSLQLPSSQYISFIDKQNGVHVQVRGLQYRIGFRARLKTLAISASERFEVYSSSASTDIDLTWTDFAIRASIKINSAPTVKFPNKLYWKVMEPIVKAFFMGKAVKMAEQNADELVSEAVEVLLNPILQKLKNSAKAAIDFDRMAALQWSVQNQYVRVALKPKSAKALPPLMPCSKMFCVDINLRNMLLAALNPAQKNMVTANDIETANGIGFTCLKPGFTCDGNHCQFFSDVVVSQTISTLDDWYNCLLFE